MRKVLFLLLLFLLSLGEIPAHAAGPISNPCSVVLHPVKSIPNIKGVALVTKVKKPYTNKSTSPIRERQSVGIYADWLPQPSTFGDYDQYEGFAQIPSEISWRFKMYPVKEDHPSWFGGKPWTGKFDEISAEIPINALVEVRPSNSKTEKLGPAILQTNLHGCKSELWKNTAKAALANVNKPTQDSEELRLQDMLINMLTPYIEKDLRSYYYPNIFKDFSPIVAPWKIEVIQTRRVNHFRGFILEITFDIEPTDGGHWISIGKDRMTYRISVGPEVKLINHTHLETYPYNSKE